MKLKADLMEGAADRARELLKAALEVWKDVTFNYQSTDTPDFVPTALETV